MKSARGILCGLACSSLLLSGKALAEKPLLKLSGTFFAYSYDLNQVYGENVDFDLLGFRVSGRYLIINMTTRSFCTYGQVTMTSEAEHAQGDELWFSPEEAAGVLLTYGESLGTRYFGAADEAKSRGLIREIHDVQLPRIQKSVLYMTAQAVDITKSFEVYGHQVRLFIEGTRSVGFKKLNMTTGLDRRFAGFKLDKIWFNRTQGLITSVSHTYSKEKRFNTYSRVYYEEHTLAKDYVGNKRQFDLMSTLNANFAREFNLAVNANYNSSSLGNVNLIMSKNWKESARVRFDMAFNKPVQYKGEAWFGTQTGFALKRVGDFVVGGRFGSRGQFLGNFSYSNVFFKHLSIFMNSSYSKFNFYGSDSSSEIWSGSISASYSSPIFNLATDYFLNRDLVGHQNLSQPRFTLSLSPLRFYGRLLEFRMTNTLILNESRSADSKQRSYSNNLTFNLGAKPLYFGRTLSLRLTMSLEQFLELSRRNFTSGGVIVNVIKEFGRGVSLEGFYSAQSRRKSQGWFVEGTTSQDLSLALRVNRTNGISGWMSLSYDPKRSELRTSFADLSVRISQVWQFHALACYDFLFKKINNIDVYLIREAGRFQLRFLWRSLSKQFLIGLSPR